MGPHFTPDTLRFLRALKRNNDREWFKARKDEYEAHVRAPMVNVIDATRRGLPPLRARARRVTPEIAVSDLSRHALQREQDAAQDARRCRLSVAGTPEARRRGALLRSRRRLGMGWRRDVGAHAAAAAACPRTHLEHVSGDSAHLAYERVPAQPRRADRPHADKSSTWICERRSRPPNT